MLQSGIDIDGVLLDDEYELGTDTNGQVRSPSQGRVKPVDEFTSSETRETEREKMSEKESNREREHPFKRVGLSVRQSIYLFRSIYVNQDDLERTDGTDEGLKRKHFAHLELFVLLHYICGLWTTHLCFLPIFCLLSFFDNQYNLKCFKFKIDLSIHLYTHIGNRIAIG